MFHPSTTVPICILPSERSALRSESAQAQSRCIGLAKGPGPCSASGHHRRASAPRAGAVHGRADSSNRPAARRDLARNCNGRIPRNCRCVAVMVASLETATDIRDLIQKFQPSSLEKRDTHSGFSQLSKLLTDLTATSGTRPLLSVPLDNEHS